MKCIFGLRRKCIVYDNLDPKEKQRYGTEEWVKIYCAMCIKSIYAKAKFMRKYSVVNTL